MESIVTGREYSPRPLIVACGPQAGGNSDYAARRLAGTLTAAGADPRIAYLRDFEAHPCIGCQGCAKSPGFACPFMRDGAQELFRLILGAPVVFFVSPIYFYHVPALFKGFIDRSQRYYRAKEAGDADLAGLPPRRAHAVLLAGRKRGEKLFEGTLLTLKYFLWPFNMALGEGVCLYGIDGPGDLEADEQACAKLDALARLARKSLS